MIGTKLRQSRQAKKFTIAQLAEKTGFSTGYISSVERGHVNPSLSALIKITSTLEVDPGFLFDGYFNTNHKHPAVKASDRLHLIYPDSGFNYELLSRNPATRKVEFLRLTIPAGASSGSEPLIHEGEEYGLVLKGTLELTIGNEVYVLERNDSFSFLSTIPHRVRNIGDGETEVVWVLTPPRL